MSNVTLTMDDVLTLLTGAKLGAERLDDSALLDDAVARVERVVLERVDATLPNPVNPVADVMAARVLRAFEVAARQTEDDLMARTGMDRNSVGVALARLEADEKVRQDGGPGEGLWTRV